MGKVKRTPLFSVLLRWDSGMDAGSAGRAGDWCGVTASSTSKSGYPVHPNICGEVVFFDRYGRAACVCTAAWSRDYRLTRGQTEEIGSSAAEEGWDHLSRTAGHVYWHGEYLFVLRTRVRSNPAIVMDR